jgi:hypothetical protein
LIHGPTARQFDLSWDHGVRGAWASDALPRSRFTLEESSMLDVLMAALALGFFALSVGYAYACDGL